MRKRLVDITVSLSIPVEYPYALSVAEDKAIEYMETCLGYGENFDNSIEGRGTYVTFSGGID